MWQCSLRNDASDRILSDDEWRDIARDLLHRTGIAPRGDAGACRWVMVRHADDHIHVAAVLVREDTGKKFFPRNDYLQARETCLAAEETCGLVRTAPVDRTALPAASRAETEKASRRGMGEPARVWLRRAVRRAAVQSRTAETFLDRLRKGGMLVRPRHDPDGQLVGYAVAQPGDVGPDGKPIWYAGRSLACDLALPPLVRRWASAPAPGPQLPPEPTEHATVGRAERTAALTNATTATEAATKALATGDSDGGGIAHAAGDLLTALGQV
ncbi:MAG: relaxase/mobilization nuclease domain-containing protein, partial [Pseudonocardiaceae bacterium]